MLVLKTSSSKFIVIFLYLSVIFYVFSSLNGLFIIITAKYQNNYILERPIIVEVRIGMVYGYALDSLVAPAIAVTIAVPIIAAFFASERRAGRLTTHKFKYKDVVA